MKSKFEKLFFQPFKDYSDRGMLLVGLIGFGLMIAVSYFGSIVFDGIMQIHLAKTEGWKIILGNVSNVVILTVGLFILAKVIYSQVRLLDILNNVLVARIPLLFAGGLTIPLHTVLPASDISPDKVVAHMEGLGTVKMLGIAVMAVVLLALLFYFFYLLVVGVRHSTNSKKMGHGVFIVLSVLLLDLLATLVYRSWFL